MPRAAIAEAKLTVNQASVQADSLSPSGPNDQTSLAHLNQNQANGADLIVTSPITPHKVNDP
jgi:hypothetical protein